MLQGNKGDVQGTTEQKSMAFFALGKSFSVPRSTTYDKVLSKDAVGDSRATSRGDLHICGFRASQPRQWYAIKKWFSGEQLAQFLLSKYYSL